MPIPVAIAPAKIEHLDLKTVTNWVQSMKSPANTRPAPATSAAPGNSGDIAFDQNFLYVCVRGKTATQAALWKRTPLLGF